MSLSGARFVRLTSRILSLAIVPCVVFAFWDNFFDPLAIKELFVLAMGSLTFLSWWASRGSASVERSLFNPLGRPLAYLLLWSLFSITWTGPKALALHHWTSFAALLLAIPPIFDFGRSRVYRATYRNLFLAVGTLLLILAAFQLNGISLGGLLRVMGGNSRTRVSLTIGHNNGVAPVLLLTSFLALGAMAETRARIFRLALFLTVLASWVLIVFFLLTRSTLIGLFVGILILVALNLYRMRATRDPNPGRNVPRWAKRLSMGGLALLVALVCLAGVWVVRGGQIEGTYNPNLARNLADRLRTLNPRFLMVDSRARLWAIGAVMMRHHPMVGLGFSSAKYDYPFYQAIFFEYHPDFPSRPTPLHSEQLHNDYLQWMAETGAVGAVLLFWCLLVFGKSILLWLRTAGRRSGGSWFGGSCLLVACFVPLLDGCFSFPGHIAPIAVYFPGLLLLWFSYCFSPTSQRRKIARVSVPIRNEATERVRPSGYAFPARLTLAAILWVALALPLGMSEEIPPWISRTEVWSPLMAQVYGRYFHGRMTSVSDEFRDLLVDMGARLREGRPVSRDDIRFVLDANWDIRDQFLEFPPFIPFAGEALYHAGSAVEIIHSFYMTTRDALVRAIRDYGPGSPVSKILREELDASAGLLPVAEDLYQRSLRNYRYHDLFRRIGRVQLELSRRSTLPSPEMRQNLVRSGRWALETARRIYFNEDTLFAEIQAAIEQGDTAAADQLVGKLVKLAPDYLRTEILPGLGGKTAGRNTKPGRKPLDPFSEKFFRLLLPHLGPEQWDICAVIFTILDGAASRDLIAAYAKAGETILPPHYQLFVDFRMLGLKSQFEDLNDELDDYERYMREEKTFGPDQRVFNLSELQKFSPKGTAPERWKKEVRRLPEMADRPLPQVIAPRMLAQAAWETGDTMGCWREHLQAQARTNLGNLEFVYERRANAIDNAFLGVAWPLFPQ